jgi:hypothetical protein
MKLITGMMLCGTNPHISTAKTLRRLYFPDNRMMLWKNLHLRRPYLRSPSTSQAQKDPDTILTHLIVQAT